MTSGSADDASDAIETRAEEASDTADETADETAEETAGASLELTAELDGATGTTGVGVPRLKIQMRPTITMTATIMIIQVLRFIELALFWCFGGDETGTFVFSVLTLCRLPYTRLAILTRRWRR